MHNTSFLPRVLLLSGLSPWATAQPEPDLAAFTHKLFAAVAKGDRNTCLSPWSVAIALAMARAGAGGDTAREIDAAFGLTDDAAAALARLAQASKPSRIPSWVDGKRTEIDAYVLRVANAAFVANDTKLLADYTRRLQSDFLAVAQRLDFGSPDARATINDWVLQQTDQRIRDLLPAGKPDRDARLVLVNCLFLKAAWAEQFVDRSTSTQAFWLAAGKSVDVKMMHDVRQLAYAPTEHLQVVGLPFEGPDLVMWIAVPRDGVSLQQARDELAAQWHVLGKTEDALIDLTLPRFTFESTAGLTDALQAMGVRAAFDRGRADFSGMTAKDQPLFINDVLHKTFIRVDENGTEAAAATAMEVLITSEVHPDEPPKPIVVRADRPFLFVIQHAKAGTLFLGQVSDPR